MEIPAGVKTHELTDSIIWFDEHGILYSSPKEGSPKILTIEEIRDEMVKFRKIIGNEKVCIVSESNPKATAPPKEHRDFIAAEINSVTKAMAIITTSPVSRMIVNLFFGLKPPPYPAKLFSNKNDAVEWIKQHL